MVMGFAEKVRTAEIVGPIVLVKAMSNAKTVNALRFAGTTSVKVLLVRRV